ncbi:MAG TPA: hypothetical protein VLQ45_04950 [Thermoanaerobaculia bacterium]|nr:hypothetical protein [Thermoanaerobaculia bacterium]
MRWEEIRQRYPYQWLLVEATQAHTVDDQRIVEELEVLETYPDVMSGMRAYKELQRQNPFRELYVLHTDRETLDITETRSIGGPRITL